MTTLNINGLLTNALTKTLFLMGIRALTMINGRKLFGSIFFSQTNEKWQWAKCPHGQTSKFQTFVTVWQVYYIVYNHFHLSTVWAQKFGKIQIVLVINSFEVTQPCSTFWATLPYYFFHIWWNYEIVIVLRLTRINVAIRDSIHSI